MYELYHLVLNADSTEKQTLLYNIAICDDDTMFREAMKDYLISMKLSNVEAFASGEEFLAIMKEDDNWLVICDFDFGTPKLMNGLQVLEAIKKKNEKTPVIILSAQDKISVAFDCLKKGAVDYFMKGTESTFTTVLTSILKINELKRLRKNEKDYIRSLVIGSVLALAIIGLLLYK